MRFPCRGGQLGLAQCLSTVMRTPNIESIDLFNFVFFFFRFFLCVCGPFKVFIEFVTVLLLFYVLVFWLRGMWNLSSPTRDRTCTPCIGRQSLNHWTMREVPDLFNVASRLFSSCCTCFCWTSISVLS